MSAWWVTCFEVVHRFDACASDKSWSLLQNALLWENSAKPKKKQKKHLLTLAALLFSFLAFISRLHEIHVVSNYTNSFSQEDVFFTSRIPEFKWKSQTYILGCNLPLFLLEKICLSLLISLFHTYLQKEITQFFFFYKQPQDQVIFVTSFTSTYLACSLVRYAMHSCRQFLWSCHHISLWPAGNPSYIEAMPFV